MSDLAGIGLNIETWKSFGEEKKGTDRSLSEGNLEDAAKKNQSQQKVPVR